MARVLFLLLIALAFGCLVLAFLISDAGTRLFGPMDNGTASGIAMTAYMVAAFALRPLFFGTAPKSHPKT